MSWFTKDTPPEEPTPPCGACVRVDRYIDRDDVEHETAPECFKANAIIAVRVCMSGEFPPKSGCRYGYDKKEIARSIYHKRKSLKKLLDTL